MEAIRHCRRLLYYGSSHRCSSRACGTYRINPLLKFIAETRAFPSRPRVKWVVVSRISEPLDFVWEVLLLGMSSLELEWQVVTAKPRVNDRQ